MQRLKTRGPQSVKILSKQLDMTTMGVRQHLAELESKGLVGQTQEERQTRGRPVHLWKLSAAGHGRFPDMHSQTTIELIDVIRSTLGEQSLNQLIDQRSEEIEAQYREQLGATEPDLQLADREARTIAQRLKATWPRCAYYPMVLCLLRITALSARLPRAASNSARLSSICFSDSSKTRPSLHAPTIC